MSSNCREFRRLLERELSPENDSELGTLSWHEHLLGCENCRELLRAEEALEVLLESLPKPNLPAHLARRVIARLRAASDRDKSLDHLLELDELASPAGLSDKILAGLQPERDRLRDPLDTVLDKGGIVEVPAGLADRVLENLSAERYVGADNKLDRLLDLDTVQTPVGLASRTLRALEAERGVEIVAPDATGKVLFFERKLVKFGAAAAAGILVFMAAWQGFSGEPKTPNNTNASVADADPELLENLWTIEHMQELMSDDVHVLLASAIDSTEEVALDLEQEIR